MESIIHWEGSRIRFPLFGPHNLANALGAISVARELGVPNAEIRDGLEAVAPLFGRSQIITGEGDGHRRLLQRQSRLHGTRADSPLRVAALDGQAHPVLGGMRELGEQTGPRRTPTLGKRLRGTSCDEVFLLRRRRWSTRGMPGGRRPPRCPARGLPTGRSWADSSAPCCGTGTSCC